MRNPNRLYRFYAEMQRVHIEHFPDWRFGQLMSNFFKWLWNENGIDPFFPEEARMVKLLKEFAGEE